MTKVNKVVYNACFGGFSLSRKGVLLAREISGNPKWGGPTIDGDFYDSGEPVGQDYGCVDVERHDPILVEVVETLGDEASGSCARLRVHYTNSQSYRIEEYDGSETVHCPDTEDYISF